MASSSAYAECNVPSFLKEGAKVEVSVGMAAAKITIVEIDYKSCWIKDDNGAWLNLNTIVGITPLTE